MKALNLIVLSTLMSFLASFALAYPGDETPSPKHDHNHGNGNGCEETLMNTGPIHFVAKDMEEKDIERLKGYAMDVVRALAPTGVDFPPHRMIFTDNNDLDHLLSSHGFVVPWWLPGAQIDQFARAGNSILEFVEGNGCSHCTSVYRNDNESTQQKSIMFHVAGHIDFGENSVYFKDRNYDRWGSGKDMAELVDNLITNHDEAEVVEFLQNLQSMGDLIDNSYGTWESPESFVRPEVMNHDLVSLKELRNRDRVTNEEQARFPKKPTATGISWYVENMPQGTPAWQKDLASAYERFNRFGSGFLQTQYMNEGWATFMQFIGPMLEGTISTNEALSYANLNWWTQHIRLENPETKNADFQFANVYYLGSQAWMRRWEKFVARDEIKDLPVQEMAEKFVKEAHQLMMIHNDESFLLDSLDQEYVSKNKLIMARAATEDEMPAEKEEGASYLKILASERNWKRIVEKIVRDNAHRPLQQPRVLLMDSNFNMESVHYRQHVEGDIPLNPAMTPMWMFTASRMHKKTVSMDTIASKFWFAQMMEQIIKGRQAQIEKEVTDKVLEEFPPPDMSEPDDVKEAWQEEAEEAYHRLLTERMAELPDAEASVYNSMPIRMTTTPNGDVKGHILLPKGHPAIQRLKEAGASGDQNAYMQILIEEVYFKVDPEWFTKWTPGADSKTDFPEVELIEDPNITGMMHHWVNFYIEDQLITNADPLNKVWAPEDKEFRDQQTMEDGSQLDSADEPNIMASVDVAKELAESSITTLGSQFGVANGGARALLKFYDLVRQRQARTLEQALAGQRPISRQDGGVKFQITPIIPHLMLDKDTQAKLIGEIPPAPASGPYTTGVSSFTNNLNTNADDGTSIAQGNVVEGDVVKQPPGEGGGQGEGEGEGDPSDEQEPGEPGEEPGDGADPGEGGLETDSQATFIPRNVWMNMLTEKLEPPVIRRTDEGENELPVEFWSHSKQQFGEPMDVDNTIDTYFENGLARVLADDPTYLDGEMTADKAQKFIQDVLEKGAESTEMDEHWMMVKDEEMEPAYAIEIIFAMDRSGSMMGVPLEIAKDVVDATIRLFRRLGIKVNTRYIHFDTKAKEVEPKEFYKIGQGGGTKDFSGLELAEKISKESSPESTNRYLFFIGDGDSHGDAAESGQVLSRMVRDMDYVAVVNIDQHHRGSERGNLPTYKKILDPAQNADLVIVDESIPSLVKALKTIFTKRYHASDEDELF